MHEGDRSRIVVAGTGLDRPVGDHPADDLPPEVGADDRERPVVVLADAAGGDVGVLGREVGAVDAALARPGMALLEVDLVVAAVAHPDLEHALDVHLDHLLLGQAVLGPEELLEDRVVEALRAEEADVEDDRLGDLSDLAAPHHRRHRRLAAHPDQRELAEAALERLVEGERVGRVRVARAGAGEDLLLVGGDPRDGLPAARARRRRRPRGRR